MGYNFNYHYVPKFAFEIDIKKDFDTEIDTDVDVKYDYNLDVYKEIDIDVDIKTDVDLDDNSAVTTGLAEDDSDKYLMDVASLAYTDDYNSSVHSTVDVVEVSGTTATPKALGDFETKAYGDNTYAELDLQVQVTDYSSVFSWTGESATD